MRDPVSLESFATKELVNVIIETPRGSRNKFKFDPEVGVYELGGVLPAGMQFPYDFGFVPGTSAEDGDPLDVLVLMDEPCFTGCLVRCRLLGVMEAEQTEEGKTTRNDRVIAVAEKSYTHSGLKNISDLNPELLHEIERFFVAYNETRQKKFKSLGIRDAERARQIVESNIQERAA
jgi:inorganic pyrophosphatase